MSHVQAVCRPSCLRRRPIVTVCFGGFPCACWAMQSDWLAMQSTALKALAPWKCNNYCLAQLALALNTPLAAPSGCAGHDPEGHGRAAARPGGGGPSPGGVWSGGRGRRVSGGCCGSWACWFGGRLGSNPGSCGPPLCVGCAWSSAGIACAPDCPSQRARGDFGAGHAGGRLRAVPRNRLPARRLWPSHHHAVRPGGQHTQPARTAPAVHAIAWGVPHEARRSKLAVRCTGFVWSTWVAQSKLSHSSGRDCACPPTRLAVRARVPRGLPQKVRQVRPGRRAGG